VTRSVFAVLLSFAIVPPAAAQSHGGAGIAGSRFSPRVDVNYLNEQWGPPDSVRMLAAVLWRGSPGWTDNPGAPVRAKRDSLTQAAVLRQVVAGGVLTPTADAWVEYNPQSRNVTLLGHSYPVPRGDSTTVFLVDRVDHVGGEPTISTIRVACAATRDVDRRSDLTDTAIEGMRQTMEHWNECLHGDQRIVEFLNHDSSR